MSGPTWVSAGGQNLDPFRTAIPYCSHRKSLVGALFQRVIRYEPLWIGNRFFIHDHLSRELVFPILLANHTADDGKSSAI